MGGAFLPLSCSKPRLHCTKGPAGKPSALRVTLAALVLAATLLAPAAAEATPMIALREAENCGGCHTPGRSQLPPMERRCTLDCQGCHVDPNGGGARNEWGYYYSHDQMAMVNFLKPIDPLQYTSPFDLHYDSKYISYTYGRDGKVSEFPMYQEFTLRLRPFYQYSHLNISYTWLHLGRHGDKLYRIGSEGDNRNREKFSIMFDALPFNTFVRAYRGTPTYGIKRSNHTQWIRERIGLGQFAVTDAVEIGGTPNVPFFRTSLLQGDPYLPDSERQKGYTLHTGLRGVSYAWHLNGSLWNTKSSRHSIDMSAIGGGFNAFGVIVYGEKNWRTVAKLTDDTMASHLHPSSTIQEFNLGLAQIKGIMPGFLIEKMDAQGVRSERTSIYIDFHPIPYLQFEIWKRWQDKPMTFNDTFGVIHGFFDF